MIHKMRSVPRLVVTFGLLGVFGCTEDPDKAVGKVDVPADAPKSSEDAAKAMLKNQGMYGGGRTSPPQGGGMMKGARPGGGAPTPAPTPAQP